MTLSLIDRMLQQLFRISETNGKFRSQEAEQIRITVGSEVDFMLDSKLELFCLSYGHGSKVAAIDLGPEQRQMGSGLCQACIFCNLTLRRLLNHMELKKNLQEKIRLCCYSTFFFAFTQAALEIRKYVRLFLNMCVTKDKRGTVEI